jgi:hypothetical protein
MDSNLKPAFEIVKDYSLSMERALVELFALAMPILFVQAVLWLWIWDLGSLTQGLDSVLSLRVGGPLFVVGVLAHELVHGVTWKVVGRLRWKDIRFGVQLKTFTPYASPTVPMRARAYRIGVMMPLMVVGLIPFVVSLIFGILAIGCVWYDVYICGWRRPSRTASDAVCRIECMCSRPP